MKRFICRIISAALALALLSLPLAACSSGEKEDSRPELTMWVFSDRYSTAFQRATAESLTSVDWRLSTVTADSDMMEQLLSGDTGFTGTLPDVFMLSPDQLPAFIESDITADLGALGLSYDSAHYYGYTIDAGTNSAGQLRAACYEPDPGLFFYRRSLAKYYLGTDDPSVMGERLSTWEGFYSTALELYEKSGGSTRMLAGTDELMLPMLSDESFVSEGRLSVSEKATDFLDLCRRMAEDKLLYNARRWSEAWAAGMSDPRSVFGYFSSGLGMENVLKPCCGGSIAGEGSYGDWAAVAGPAAYNWGGCWLAVRAGSPMAAEAAELINYFTAEEEAMCTDRLISGSFSASRVVSEQIKFDSQFSESFLSAQNCYSLMASAADGVSMGSLAPQDSVLHELFAQCAADYAFDRTATPQQAMEAFERMAAAAFPELGE